VNAACRVVRLLWTCGVSDPSQTLGGGGPSGEKSVGHVRPLCDASDPCDVQTWTSCSEKILSETDDLDDTSCLSLVAIKMETPSSKPSPSSLAHISPEMTDVVHGEILAHSKFQSKQRRMVTVKAIFGFFLFVSLILVWLGNGVLTDPLWRTQGGSGIWSISIRKGSQEVMLKILTIAYWVHLAAGFILVLYIATKEMKGGAHSKLSDIVHFVMFGLGVLEMVGAGFLTKKLWEAKTDPDNHDNVLLNFTYSQVVMVKIMSVLIWVDIVFAGLLFIHHVYLK